MPFPLKICNLKKNAQWTDGPMYLPTDRPTDRQTHILRCVDSSKNGGKKKKVKKKKEQKRGKKGKKQGGQAGQ